MSMPCSSPNRDITVNKRLPKSGILRLDITKPKRSSGGSVEFRSQPQWFASPSPLFSRSQLRHEICKKEWTETPSKLELTIATIAKMVLDIIGVTMNAAAEPAAKPARNEHQNTVPPEPSSRLGPKSFNAAKRGK
uniref:Uncharacterized protein n=1 Tax=Glossina palpalis gambiensis TaxID=67801 RepID=A0A1B0C663_9MUSC